MARTWERGHDRHLLEIDNDSLLLNHVDGLYTSGVRYRWLRTRVADDVWYGSEWSIGHQMYTPLDIKLPATLVQPPDRPYAAWLYTRFGLQRQQGDGAAFGWGFTLGCIGPCAHGETVQTHLHRLLKQPEPQGGAKEIKHEGGLQLDINWAAARHSLGDSSDWQSWGLLRLGNINTDASAGLQWRAGRLNRLPQQPALYAYLQPQLRAVAYDATLQGGVFNRDSPHTVQPRRLQGWLDAGLQWQGAQWSANLALQMRSNAIRELDNRRGRQTIVMLSFGYQP